MQLEISRVWNYLTPEVKEAFVRLAKNRDYIHTSTLLGALRSTSQPVVSTILDDLENELEGDLIESLDGGEIEGDFVPPEDLSFSPCVREVLNFYRIHQLQPVSAADLALRLLQIGTGSTVKELEKNGVLRDYQESLAEQSEL